ncbi:MAG TPA: N-formylglutamate amidohydrolase [Euzebya sp.]|nr:N-formylglutamate amidohydrolase [Euzebya sp.]
MEFSSWAVDPTLPVLATAIHAGHGLRPEVADRMVLDPRVRRREEDPHTDELAEVIGSYVFVHRSRFEVDLNRDRNASVYAGPDDAWGLELWARPLEEAVVERSRALHDAFYACVADTLDDLVSRHGGFVLYDVHSYNHRRDGPDGPPADPTANPGVNLGTGSLPGRWKPLAQSFLDTMNCMTVGGEAVDARENVKFVGRNMPQFVHDRYGEVGCALAIECKKTFMDEWTGRVDGVRLTDLRRALAATVEPVWNEHLRCR